MRVAVIVTNAGQAANVDGGKCETEVIVVEAGLALSEVITVAKKNGYNTVSLAIVRDDLETK